MLSDLNLESFNDNSSGLLRKIIVNALSSTEYDLAYKLEIIKSTISGPPLALNVFWSELQPQLPHQTTYSQPSFSFLRLWSNDFFILIIEAA